MSKKYAFVTTFVFLLILSGCGRNIQYYTHPASSNNAYIQGSRTDYNYVVTYPISVDGELIEDEAIKTWVNQVAKRTRINQPRAKDESPVVTLPDNAAKVPGTENYSAESENS